MKKIIKDPKYGFSTAFNTETGEYIRAFDVKNDPFQASFPHLIDVGIMASCAHGISGLCQKSGIQCYQQGNKACGIPDMSLDDYREIVRQCKGKTFEFALGGRGDVDMHKDFEEILQITRENGIVPNFTTSGFGMTKKKAEICRRYCGAVAVSMYSRLDDIVPEIAIRRLKNGETRIYRDEEDIPVLFTLGGANPECAWDSQEYVIKGEYYEWDEQHHISYSENPQKYEMYRVFNERGEWRRVINDTINPNYTMKAIKLLLDAGVKTNIHYVLSNSTIDEALIRLMYNGFHAGINAVIFLLHKPVGLGSEEEVLSYDDPRVRMLFRLVDTKKLPFKVGFDSCSIPGVLNFCHNIDERTMDTCEGGRYSMYIDAQMNAMPCSFDNQEKRFAVKLSENFSIQDAWNSKQFDKFRSSLKHSCPSCPNRELCMGGCPIRRQIVLCDRSEKYQI